jgi:hypothetical protein
VRSSATPTFIRIEVVRDARPHGTIVTNPPVRRHSGTSSVSLADQLMLDTPFSMLMRLAIRSSFGWSFGCIRTVAVTTTRD